MLYYDAIFVKTCIYTFNNFITRNSGSEMLSNYFNDIFHFAKMCKLFIYECDNKMLEHEKICMSKFINLLEIFLSYKL